MAELEPGATIGSPGSLQRRGGQTKEFTFQFNPTSYSVSKSADWRRTPNNSSDEASPPEFVGSNARSMTVKFLLDASESTSDSTSKDHPADRLKQQIELLFDWLVPTEESKKDKRPRPPLLLFGWGETRLFVTYLKNVSVEYRMFGARGECTRASGSLTLEQVPIVDKKQNPTSGGTAGRRVHTVIDSDSLMSIAYANYDRPDFWRPLAMANNIEDPLRLPPGTHVMLPTAEELLELAAADGV